MDPILKRWHPITHDFGLIQAPLQEVVRQYCAWHASLGRDYRRRELTAGLESAFSALPPLSMNLQRKLFLATDSDWTAFFQNGIQGSDPFPPMRQLSERLGVLAMRVCRTPLGFQYPAVIWEIYAPTHLGGDRNGCGRTLYVSNDGGRWVFGQSGAPYPFEQTARYAERRKRDRFPPELLAEYLLHFGIRVDADDFYLADPEHPAVLLDSEPQGIRLPEFSLQQVLDGMPWRRTG